MKLLKEEVQEVANYSISNEKIGIENSTDPEVISYIRNAIQSEQEAIAEYEIILGALNLSKEQVDTLTEILTDEKDHIVLLTKMLQDLTQQVYPANGDE